LDFVTEPFRYEFMQRAMLVCVLIGFTNGFLGAFVILRRLALTADALAHSLLPGLYIVAFALGIQPH
jgi:ABC-type Mn2+/Zn2+ transport system permease subunit